MPEQQLSDVIRYIRRIAGTEDNVPTDRELLAAFAARKDEAAFTAMVKRHGPMVMGICRRILHHLQDAEDAFQATFLLLARRSRGIRKQESLASWLHGVAYRMAHKAKKSASRRRKYEGTVPPAQSDNPTAALEWREVQAILDDEIQRLPQTYRTPFILFYLENTKQAEIAVQLGIKEGTVWSRLAHARRLLQERLSRRGVALPAVLGLLGVSAEAALATMPPSLTASVEKLVLQAAAAGIPASVVALVEGEMRKMVLSKLRIALFLTLTAVGFGAGALAYHTKAENPAERGSSPPPPPEVSVEQKRTDLYGDPLPPGVLMRLGTIRMRDRHMSVVFSPGGKTVISAGLDMIIRTWDPATGKELRRIPLEATKPLLNGLRLSADGKTAEAYTDREGETLYVWDAVTGKLRLSIPGHTYATALSADGKILAAELRSEKTQMIHLWDTTSGKVRYRLAYPQDVVDLAFSADSNLLGAVGRDENLRIWDTATGKVIRTIQSPVRELAFSPDGKMVGSGVKGDVVKIWRVADGKELFAFPKIPIDGLSLAFSPDDKYLAAGTLNGAMLFDTVAGKLVRRFPAGWCIVGFSPDSKTLFAWLASATHLWDIASGREIMPRPGHDGEVSSLLPMPDGKSLRSLGGYSEIRTWDLTSGKPLSVAQVGPFLLHRNGKFSSDGKCYISGNRDGSIRFWDLGSGRELRRFSINPLNRNIQNAGVLALGLSAEGNRLATLCGGSEQQAQGGYLPKRWIETLDAETGKTIHRWPVEVMGPSASFAPDGRTLVFRTEKGLAVRDAHTNHELAAIQGDLCGPFVFSPDGGFLAAASFKRVAPPGKRRRIEMSGGDIEAMVLVEMATGRQVVRLETGPYYSVLPTFSPDCGMMATANRESFIIWDTATGKELFRRPLPEKGNVSRFTSYVSSLAFLPHGDALATGMIDSTILIWDISPALRRAREMRKSLAPDELKSLWSDLASEDAGRAYRAAGRLEADPAKTISILKERLRPLAPLDEKEVQSLLADLDNDLFTVRDKASKKLASFGEQAEPALCQALEGKPSLEMRKRLEALHADAELASYGIVRSTESVRTLRAIRILEHIGDQEARQLLQKLASGDPAARTTRQAKEVLQRLQHRTANKMNH